jgi:hypothetical protein
VLCGRAAVVCTWQHRLTSPQPRGGQRCASLKSFRKSKSFPTCARNARQLSRRGWRARTSSVALAPCSNQIYHGFAPGSRCVPSVPSPLSSEPLPALVHLTRTAPSPLHLTPASTPAAPQLLTNPTQPTGNRILLLSKRPVPALLRNGAWRFGYTIRSRCFLRSLHV